MMGYGKAAWVEDEAGAWQVEAPSCTERSEKTLGLCTRSVISAHTRVRTAIPSKVWWGWGMC